MVCDAEHCVHIQKILLKAAEKAIEVAVPTDDDPLHKWYPIERNKIARLTIYQSTGEEVYKVWPTNEDRQPFQAVMDCLHRDDFGSDKGRMADAYRFFRTSVSAYLSSNDTYPALQRLVTGLRDYLKPIVLDLTNGDEPTDFPVLSGTQTRRVFYAYISEIAALAREWVNRR